MPPESHHPMCLTTGDCKVLRESYLLARKSLRKSLKSWFFYIHIKPMDYYLLDTRFCQGCKKSCKEGMWGGFEGFSVD